MQISVYTDGGSRGNPGLSGLGIVIYDPSQKIITKITKFLGVKTNNEAEYLALIEALTWIRDHRLEYNISQIDFFTDSQLLSRQMSGKYKIKAANIKPLYQTALSLLATVNLPSSFHEVLREQNSLADLLANHAMDQKS
jgi:ribonuclease HI